MKHLAIAAASATAIAAAVIAVTYDGIPLFGGEPAQAEHVASSKTFEKAPAIQLASADIPPVDQLVQPAVVETAAMDTVMDEAVCDETEGASQSAAAGTGMAGSVTENGTDAETPGAPLRLTSACGHSADGTPAMRGLSAAEYVMDDGEYGVNIEGVRLAENRMPTESRYVPRRPQALGSGAAAFDMLETGSTPPTSASVKTSSDYKE